MHEAPCSFSGVGQLASCSCRARRKLTIGLVVALGAVAEGIWVGTEPGRIGRMRATVTMTVMSLAPGAVALHSPISLTDERRAEIERLGTVKHLIAPNLFHHRWLGEWADAYPAARLHVPRGLAKKRPDLPLERASAGETEAAFAGVLELESIAGFRLRELAVLHRASRTLVVADLVHNIGRPQDPWTKLYSRTMGFYDKVALSRVIRFTAFSDAGAARRSVDRLLSWDFDRLIVGHGAPVTAGAKDALAGALAWLR